MPSRRPEASLLLKRTNSLLDLSSVCEMERQRIQQNPHDPQRFQPQVPLPRHPVQRPSHQPQGSQQPQGISLLKRALTSPGGGGSESQRSGSVHVVQIPVENSHVAHQQPSVMRLVGLKQRSKTVIALMPPSAAAGSSPGAASSGIRPAHQQQPTTTSQMISISRIGRVSPGSGRHILGTSPNSTAVSLVRTTSL